MERKVLLWSPGSHKDRFWSRPWRWAKTLFFLLTMLASLLLVCAPPLLVVILDLLIPPALLSVSSNRPFSPAKLASQWKAFDFRSSLVDLPLLSAARSLLILCAYIICDGRGPYLGVATLCSVASAGYVSVKGIGMHWAPSFQDKRRLLGDSMDAGQFLGEGKDGVAVEALFLSSLALAAAHIVVAYKTSCRERRKLLVYRIDIEAVKQKGDQALPESKLRGFR